MNCPFCDDINYDKMGLWRHLNTDECLEYQAWRADMVIAAAAKKYVLSVQSGAEGKEEGDRG